MVDAPRSKGGFDLKDYVEVKDRIRLFYEKWPTGALVTGEVRISIDDDTPRVIVQAFAYRTPDDPHPGVGWSWLELPGKTSYTKGSELENAETSAWGRAIGSLGIGIDKSIASPDEIKTKAGQGIDDADDGSLIGIVAKGKPPVDLELRETPDGPIAGFKLTQGRGGLQVLASGNLATALQPELEGLVGQRVSCWGSIELVPWDKDGKPMPPYKRMNLSRIATPEFVLPGVRYGAQTSDGPEGAGPPDGVIEAESAPLFTEGEWAGV